MSDSSTGGTSGGQGSDPGQSSGVANGGVPDGFVHRSELEKANQRAASFQSAADQAKSQLNSLMGELGEMKSLMSAFDPNQIASQVQSALARAQALESEKVKLKGEFEHARPEVYEGSFATPEELRAAVEQSHQSEAQRAQALREQIEADIRSAYKEKHGVDLAPVNPPKNDAGEVKLTAADVAAMSMSDRLALSDDELAALTRQGA